MTVRAAIFLGRENERFKRKRKDKEEKQGEKQDF